MTTTTAPPAPAQAGEGLRERALNEVAGRRELATAMAATVRLARPEPINAFAARSEIYATAAKTFIATGQLPGDFDARLAEVDAKVAVAATRGEHLAQVRSIIRGQLEECERRGLDIALAVLHRELLEMVAEVRELEPRLAGFSDTGAALRCGGAVAEAARRLLDLVDRHQTLRGAQLDFHMIAMGGASHGQRCRQLLEAVGLVRNAAEVDPALARRERNELVAPCWPLPMDSPEHLRWLAGEQAQPWVPSTAELEAAHADLRRREQEADYERDRAQGLVPSPGAQRAIDKRVSDELAYHSSRAEAEATARALKPRRDN